MELNYEEDMRINQDALDVEWLNQPGLMHKYTSHSAMMKRLVDETKERLETQKALLDVEIRTDPSSHGLGKITEGAIQSTILLDMRYQQASQAYIDAKFEYDMSVAAVRAMDQRKTALEELGRLLNLSYFAGPQIPRDLSQEVIKAAATKRANAKVKIKQRNENENEDKE